MTNYEEILKYSPEVREFKNVMDKNFYVNKIFSFSSFKQVGLSSTGDISRESLNLKLSYSHGKDIEFTPEFTYVRENDVKLTYSNKSNHAEFWLDLSKGSFFKTIGLLLTLDKHNTLITHQQLELKTRNQGDVKLCTVKKYPYESHSVIKLRYNRKLSKNASFKLQTNNNENELNTLEVKYNRKLLWNIKLFNAFFFNFRANTEIRQLIPTKSFIGLTYTQIFDKELSPSVDDINVLTNEDHKKKKKRFSRPPCMTWMAGATFQKVKLSSLSYGLFLSRAYLPFEFKHSLFCTAALLSPSLPYPSNLNFIPTMTTQIACKDFLGKIKLGLNSIKFYGHYKIKNTSLLGDKISLDIGINLNVKYLKKKIYFI